MDNNERLFNIAFVHPDLGIGGAERLVVDAAVGLQNMGHKITIYTSHCSPTHSFRETQDGTLRVKVFGDFLPQKIFGRLRAVCAYLRMFFISLILLLQRNKYDVIFVDQISLPIPLLKLSGAKIMFYCHYPDKCLTHRNGLLKKLYRTPIDFLEEITTKSANKIVVNSKYTRSVFEESFRRIAETPDVLYPAVNFKQFEDENNFNEVLSSFPFHDKVFFLSINRFERKKNINLAVEAFSVLQTLLPISEFKNLHLVLAGGYDPLLRENKEVVDDLRQLIDKEGLVENVSFLLSFNEEQKKALLSACFAVIYTPSNEHFGIVPIEGMFFAKPVIAVRSGGPTESILHEKTGFLCDDNPAAFATAMSELLKNRQMCNEMGKEGREWVTSKFSLDQFARELNDHLQAMTN